MSTTKRIERLLAKGVPLPQIAAKTGVSYQAVYYHAKKNGRNGRVKAKAKTNGAITTAPVGETLTINHELANTIFVQLPLSTKATLLNTLTK